MEHIDRPTALLAARRYYFDGRPCKNGNIAERTTSNQNCICSACAFERSIKAAQKRAADPDAARAGYRANYVANLMVMRERSKRRYAATAEVVTAQLRKTRRENPGKNREICRKWRDKNPDYERLRYAADIEKALERSREWKKNNPGRAAERIRQWRQDNPSLHAARVAKRRAMRLQATPSWLTKQDLLDMDAVYSEARRLQGETGQEHHVDHIVPLKGRKVSGLHVPWNLKAIPAIENMKKSNRHEV